MPNYDETYQHGNITMEGMEEDERNSQNTAQTTQNVFDVNNYLNVKLKDTEDEKVLKIRLLPIDKNANTPFKRIKMHSIKLKPEQRSPNQSEWKSFVCLEKTEDIDHSALGCKCPFCEENKRAYELFRNAANDVDKDRWKKISLSLIPTDVGIVRCIERGHENEGPKFWKFTIRQDGLDPMSAIKRCYKTALEESIEEGDEPLNILDVYKGKDLKVTIKAVYDKEGKRTNKTSTTIETFGKQKPISEDMEQVSAWVNDSKVWSDVFVAKPYDYLSIILEGGKPYFNKSEKKWVAASEQREQQNVEVRKSNDDIAKATAAATTGYVPNTATTIDTEDIPF